MLAIAVTTSLWLSPMAQRKILVIRRPPAR